MNKKHIYFCIVPAAIAAIMVASPAIAQDQDNNAVGKLPKFIQQYDQDGDGKIDLAEFPTAEQQFQRLDADGDGFIDTEEAPGPRYRGKRRAGRMFARFDADSDGTLSRQEFPGPDDRFDWLDTNEDDTLSKAEMAAGRQQAFLARNDHNGDGRVSSDEFSGPAELFDRLDANGDGFID